MVSASHPSQREAAGFTLIEVMLAVVIFAIVLTSIHLLFHGALQLRNKTAESIERALPLQQTLAIIGRDLANIVLPGGTLFGELQTVQTGSATNVVDMLNPVDPSMPGQSTPAFYTTSGVIDDNYPWSELQRVSYALMPATNGLPGKDLVRTVTRNLLPVTAEQPLMQRLLHGVETVTVLFYDGLQWREDWDSTVATNKLPLGIKMQLQLASEPSDRSYHAPVEVVAPVILQAGTNEVAQASGGAP
jgi:general secretion pathway protein J